jgi:hypothetical protein
MMKLDRNTLMILATAFAIGYWLAGGKPEPEPKPLDDRPVVRWIVRTAKQLLWIAVFVEPAPADVTDRHLARTHTVGPDGYAVIDHGDGW